MHEQEGMGEKTKMKVYNACIIPIRVLDPAVKQGPKFMGTSTEDEISKASSRNHTNGPARFAMMKWEKG